MDMCDGVVDREGEGRAHEQQSPRELPGTNGEEQGMASQSTDNPNDVIANSRPPVSLVSEPLTQGIPNESEENTPGRTELQHTTATTADDLMSSPTQTQGTDEAHSSQREETNTSIDAESGNAIVSNNGQRTTPPSTSGEAPQADGNNSTFEHRSGDQPDASVPCAQDNNLTGGDNHSACETPNSIHPTHGGTSGRKQQLATRTIRRTTAGRRPTRRNPDS